MKKLADYETITSLKYNAMSRLIDEGVCTPNKHGVYYKFFRDLDGNKFKVRVVLDPEL